VAFLRLLMFRLTDQASHVSLWVNYFCRQSLRRYLSAILRQ